MRCAARRFALTIPGMMRVVNGVVARLLPGRPADALRFGRLDTFGGAPLDGLASARRLLNRLDWWTLDEWRHSDAFFAVGDQESAVGAALFVPADFDDAGWLASARSAVAWLRWCAVADGVPAAETLRPLLAGAISALDRAGIRHAYALVDSAHWAHPYLSAAGFERADGVATLRLSAQAWRERRSAAAVQQPRDLRVRDVGASDMEAVRDIDAGAFEEQWRFSGAVLERARRSAAWFGVAERQGRPLGFAFATQADDEAHITRIAVRAECQQRGVGTALLAEVLDELIVERGAMAVTLNTQSSNTVSQRLYQRFGFKMLQPVMQVLRAPAER
jgi:ribosomal-protein-alanine N-acetyltransferase